MAAKNDVTGDSIRSKHSKKYQENYDKIFNKKKEEKKEAEWPDNPIEGGRIV